MFFSFAVLFKFYSLLISNITTTTGSGGILGLLSDLEQPSDVLVSSMKMRQLLFMGKGSNETYIWNLAKPCEPDLAGFCR